MLAVQKDGQVVGQAVMARWTQERFAFTTRGYEELAWVVASTRAEAERLAEELLAVLEALRRWQGGL